MLDLKSHRRVDGYDSTSVDWSEIFDLVENIPEPDGRANIETKGQLSAAHEAVRRQIIHLYEVRVKENSEGRFFSSAVESHISSFERRLIRWSNGRGSAKSIFSRVPNV